MNQTNLAYCAGLLDGEGYVGIKKAKPSNGRVTPAFIARVQIRMINETAIRFFAETMGGWYYPEKKAQKKRRRLYCYQAHQQQAEDILRSLLPFLKVKRENALTVLRLRELQRQSPKHRTKQTGTQNLTHYASGRRLTVPRYCLSDEYVAECDSLHAHCKLLNAA